MSSVGKHFELSPPWPLPPRSSSAPEPALDAFALDDVFLLPLLPLPLLSPLALPPLLASPFPLLSAFPRDDLEPAPVCACSDDAASCAADASSSYGAMTRGTDVHATTLKPRQLAR
jgi:hypothetical protein